MFDYQPLARNPTALCTLGLNHTTASLEMRERVAFAPEALGGRAEFFRA